MLHVYLFNHISPPKKNRNRKSNPEINEKIAVLSLRGGYCNPSPTGMRKLELWQIRTGRNIGGEGTP